MARSPRSATAQLGGQGEGDEEVGSRHQRLGLPLELVGTLVPTEQRGPPISQMGLAEDQGATPQSEP